MQKSACFEAAKVYLNFGLSVIPLMHSSKRPALDSWVEFQQRRPTLTEIETWWQNGTDKGIAIVCGKVSNLIVLDIDDPDKFGIALEALGETLPDTPIVQTPKGWHVYFKYPQNRVVRRHNRLADWGAELRGDACYVVAPPTEIDGHRYHWAKRNGKLMALGQVPLADCPEWLLDAFGVPLADQTPNEPNLNLQPENQPATGSLSLEQKQALKAILLFHWHEGQRHELALGLAGLLAKSGIAQNERLNCYGNRYGSRRQRMA
jgi:Bifunctional DNA primase/polymerase, N-terminal.